ncbi:hypothetical protein ACFJIV_29205 [Mucilaginibacter sp. UC70_90]
MRDFDKKTKSSLVGIEKKKINIERYANQDVRNKKILLSKKPEKTYKVTITYIQLTDEEAKTKLAIVESILKKVHGK